MLSESAAILYICAREVWSNNIENSKTFRKLLFDRSLIDIELFLCEVIRFRHTNSDFMRESTWRCLRQVKMGFKSCEIGCTEDKNKNSTSLSQCYVTPLLRVIHF